MKIDIQDIDNEYILDVLSTIPDNVSYEIINKENIDSDVIRRFTDNLLKGKGNKSILTHIHREFMEFNKNYDSDSELDILTLDKIKERILDDFNKFTDEKLYNIKLKAINALNFSLAVNDEEAMLMLYGDEDSEEPVAAIVSSDPKVIEWAYGLFDKISLKSEDEWKNLD